MEKNSLPAATLIRRSATAGAACAAKPDGLPVDVRAELFASHLTVSEPLDSWAVLGGNPAAWQLPLPNCSLGHPQFFAEKLKGANDEAGFV
jgi:hypothetical protein